MFTNQLNMTLKVTNKVALKKSSDVYLTEVALEVSAEICEVIQ